MNDQSERVKGYLLKIGFKAEVADIYIALLSYGPQTISEVARRSGVERTRIYRMLDELKSSNLLEVEVRYKRSILRAAPIANSHILLAKKERDVYELRDELAILKDKLAVNLLESPAMRVQSYQGIEGLKQMLWNQTKTKSEIISFLSESMQQQTDIVFFERWVSLCNERQLSSRSIIGDEFIAAQKKWYASHANERLTNWQGRYATPELLPISYSTVVYDNVTTYYHWKNGELFGVEIYNQEIADTQRRLFEMVWVRAVDFDDTEIERLHQNNHRI